MSLRSDYRGETLTRCIGIILLIALSITMAVLLVTSSIEIRDYATVDAVLEKVSSEYGTGSKSDMMQFKTASYRFQYNGREWVASRPTFFLNKNDEGEKVKIRCSPEDPTVLANKAYIGAESAILALCILSFFAVAHSVREESCRPRKWS